MGIINGMTRAASALTYWERRQEVTANNLANADTHGFKAQKAFARMVGDAMLTVSTATNAEVGSLKQTDNPLDLALGAQGYFVVQTPQGERFTRSGSFRLDTEGRLVDQRGNPVLGDAGPLQIPPGSVAIDTAGVIAVNGKEVGRLRIESVPAGTALAHEGGTLFVPDGTQTPVALENRSVQQGFLEDSNVNTVGSMVDLISIQRNYAAVQRTMTTLDGIRHTISTELGKPV